MTMTISDAHLSQSVDQILKDKKYRQLGIPRETVEDLILHENIPGLDEKVVLKRVRKKMHHLIAPYLEDLNYAQASNWLEEAYQSTQQEPIKAACLRIMQLHASTRERLPHLDEFYATIFFNCGKPESILDLACGLNPLAIPWMDLPANTEYHAYDIHTPRIELINHFFRLEHRSPLGEVRDILIHPPEIKADLAFFFEEAHRMEQRRKGANRELWAALKVKNLIISLPAFSLNGNHDLRQQMRQLVKMTTRGLPWEIREFRCGNELLFCIQK